jgi:hypothetical protein
MNGRYSAARGHLIKLRLRHSGVKESPPHMSEQSVWRGLGRPVEIIDSGGLGRGAAECPCGVVRRVVLPTS